MTTYPSYETGVSGERVATYQTLPAAEAAVDRLLDEGYELSDVAVVAGELHPVPSSFRWRRMRIGASAGAVGGLVSALVVGVVVGASVASLLLATLLGVAAGALLGGVIGLHDHRRSAGAGGDPVSEHLVAGRFDVCASAGRDERATSWPAGGIQAPRRSGRPPGCRVAGRENACAAG